jgi:hypothetical protein
VKVQRITAVADTTWPKRSIWEASGVWGGLSMHAACWVWDPHCGGPRTHFQRVGSALESIKSDAVAAGTDKRLQRK